MRPCTQCRLAQYEEHKYEQRLEIALTIRASSLETEHLVRQFADWPGLLIPQRFGSLLHGADHGRWTTHQDLHVICRWRKVGL